MATKNYAKCNDVNGIERILIANGKYVISVEIISYFLVNSRKQFRFKLMRRNFFVSRTNSTHFQSTQRRTKANCYNLTFGMLINLCHRHKHTQKNTRKTIDLQLAEMCELKYTLCESWQRQSVELNGTRWVDDKFYWILAWWNGRSNDEIEFFVWS